MRDVPNAQALLAREVWALTRDFRQPQRGLAIVQIRNQTEGRAYFDRRKTAGKTSVKAMRSLKCRLSDIVHRAMIAEAIAVGADPGRQWGNGSDSSAASLSPHTGTSEKPQPGPAAPSPRPALPAAS